MREQASDATFNPLPGHAVGGAHGLMFHISKIVQLRSTTQEQRLWTVRQVEKLAKVLGNGYGMQMVAALRKYIPQSDGEVIELHRETSNKPRIADKLPLPLN